MAERIAEPGDAAPGVVLDVALEHGAGGDRARRGGPAGAGAGLVPAGFTSR